MLSVITAIATLFGMQLVKAKRWEGWAVGIAVQVLWVFVILESQQWGLFILTAALTWTYATALIQWRQDAQTEAGV